MLKFFILSTFVALLQAAPVDDVEKTTPKFVDILESNNDRQDDGSYMFSYRGADATYRQENGVVVDQGGKDEHLVVKGSYSFMDVDGQEVVVHYTADKNGFVPVGNKIPEEISKAAQSAVEFSQMALEEDVDPQEQTEE